MSGKRVFEALNAVDDKYLDLAEGFRKESDTMKGTIKRKTLTGLLAAVVCISMLAVTAVATGWIPGIFRALQEEYPEDAALFEAAAQANTEIVPEFAEIPQLDMSKFVLLEKYYDGETLLLGYDLDAVIPEPTVGFQPDKVLLRRIKKSPALSQVGWDAPKDWQGTPVTENAKKYHLGEDAFVMDQMMKGTLSDEGYERAWQLLKSQGWVCLVTRDLYIGDHILVNGLEYYDPDTNPDGLRVDYATDYGDCIRLESLPEAVRDQESVTVTMKVRVGIQYWYMDLEGNGWCCWESGGEEEVSFTLENIRGQGTDKEDAE